MTNANDLLETLHRYWGYSSFRPLQESIVRSLLGGRDTCVVMPTGGGKSLCYQLPAVMPPRRTVIVVSPLIALMQDQVAQLSQMGIPAAVLNSTLGENEQAVVIRRAQEGMYRLLYLSPERLGRADTVEWLRRVPISIFAIDEAHCISEWGHEFRPDYRKLSGLRDRFPDCAIAAVTASATQQVRHDIIEQLKLRDPHRYIASFHRPNLRYLVRETNAVTQDDLLVSALRKHTGQSAIVYSPTIARVAATISLLRENGIEAIPYHGKMDVTARGRNQERWISSEACVLVGTLAFGLGINKADVRAVIHLSLPKSVEQYYQEAGRAGRDGRPADCLLLWRKQDAGLLAHFIGEIEDAAEKERAWQRYHAIRRFAESRVCRHLQICRHFGENPKWRDCAACDVCAGGFEPLEATAFPERPRHKKKGGARQRAAGAAQRPMSEISRAPAPPERPWREKKSGAPVADSAMHESLRAWRTQVSREQGVPAFVVLHDKTIAEICSKRPRSLIELRGVSGFGEKKTERYGQQILEILRQSAASPAPRPS